MKIGLKSKNRSPSEETRKKISNSLKGPKNPQFGKKRTQEEIERNRQANLGKKRSEETRKKISECQKGKRKSDGGTRTLGTALSDSIVGP